MLVSLATDVPVDRAMTFSVTVQRGAATDGAVPLPACSWRRVAPGAMIDAGVQPSASTSCVRGDVRAAVLPGSFAVVARAGESLDDAVTVVIEAAVAASGAAPAVTFRRFARFSFVPRTTWTLPVFLSLACGAAATGCRTVPAPECTVSVRCEEMGTTCDDHGECRPVTVVPGPTMDAAADVTDIGVPPGDAPAGTDAPPTIDATDTPPPPPPPPPCVQDAPCGQSDHCREGHYDCVSDSCQAGALLPTGTRCDLLPYVCNASGACVFCNETRCSPAPCVEGWASCATGVSVCNPTGNSPAGTACPTGGTCDGAGGCCTQGQFCGGGMLTEFACGCGNPPPGAGWVDQGGGCWHRFVDPPVSC
ncbi:MAG: hypothetical protein WCJ30_08930 [Deltaproteobacteria bacterium]